MSDVLEPAIVEPLLRGRFGRPYVYQAGCGSTQQLVGAGAAEGTIAVCEFQSAGRGRLGRSWVAPRGTAIHCSVVLHPPRGAAPQELTLVGALAAAAAIDAAVRPPVPGTCQSGASQVPVRCQSSASQVPRARQSSARHGLAAQIKWPNDVYLGEHKVGGVLGELRDGIVVLGIGINVNQTREQLPPDARRPAASLRTCTGRELARAPLLAALLFELERRYTPWQADGLAALHAEVEGRDFLRGRDISIDGLRGRVAGIDESGRLMLELDRGELRRIESGEVEYG